MEPYVTWIPEYDGHKPPFLRDDTLATVSERWDNAGVVGGWMPTWIKGHAYLVERAAVHPEYELPEQTEEQLRAEAFRVIKQLVGELREYPAEELAKHGVALEPEKAWEVGFFLDVRKIAYNDSGDYLVDMDLSAIEYIRNNARPLA